MACIISIRDVNGQSITLHTEKAIDKELVSNDNVIQSKEYFLEVTVDDEDVKSVIATVGNSTYILRCEEIGRYKLKKRFFNCIWGYTSIIVEVIKMKGTTNEFYYSQMIEVLLATDDSKANQMEESLGLMVEYIVDKNSNLLNVPIRNKKSLINKALKQSSVKTLRTEVQLLKEIIECYKKNIGYFMRDLKYKVISGKKLEDFENVAYIDLETINHIISYPEELYSVDYPTGIRVFKQNYVPRRTITTTINYDYNIYENQVILGFIFYLVNYIRDRVKEVEAYVGKHNSVYSIVRVKNYYYIWYLHQMKDMLKHIEDIYYQYRQIMKCEIINIDSICKPSKIFLSQHHYREIYTVIQKWFEEGNYNFIEDDIMAEFLTADQIYEYYCLLNFIDIINELGFKSKKKPDSFCYPKCRYTYSGDNTFVFEDMNGRTEVVLYYQPVLYSDRFENKIELFRTNLDRNNKESWYTPDYIIKVESGGITNYSIFDAKWQERETINKYTFIEMVYKYIFSISMLKNNNLKEVYILQGRDDESTHYEHHNGELSNKLLVVNQPRSGIINFTPMSYSKRYISKLIQGLIN